MRRWEITTGTLVLVLALILIIALVVFGSVFARTAAPWTGFAADPLPSGVTATPVVMYELDKDLWDWLQLLLVPLVLAVGGFWLTRTENRYALTLQERREKGAQRLEDERIEEARRIEEERIRETRRIEDERAKDAALQAYLDQMTELLLHENLLTSQAEDVVRTVARARTLTVLKQLDGLRKSRVVQFLSEARLCVSDKDKSAVVSLQGADLREVNLKWVNLKEANLQETDLQGANLQVASLQGANLQRAKLQGADLKDASLQGANLRTADLQGADLQWANLQEADLQLANLQGVNLQRAKLQSAVLWRADLRGATLHSADFRGADLDGAIGLPDYLLYT